MLLRGLSRGQLLASDAILAVAVGLLGLLAAIEVPLPSRGGWHEPPWASLLAAVLLGASVAVRRLRPEAAAWSALVIVSFTLVSGLIPDFAGLAPTVALGFTLYTVGAEVHRRSAVRVVVVSVVVIAAGFGWASRQAFLAALVTWVVGACWALGRTARERRAYAARSAEQATALAVGEERLRIARELHDLVGHNVSMIAVRATIADHIADERPQEMREALRIIASTSRDSLAELRRALAALRIEGALTPSPRLGDLDKLADTARSAGLTVDLDVRGSDDKVPEGLGLAVFRMVQESITNVLKHAGATSCRIDVDIGPETVRVTVTDDGSGDPGPGVGAPGQGLIGMNERAAMFDGDVAAGPRPGGGWSVEATLRYAS